MNKNSYSELCQEDKLFLENYINYFKFIDASTGTCMGGISSLDDMVLYKSKFSDIAEISTKELLEYFKDPKIQELRLKVIDTNKQVKALGARTFESGKTKLFTVTYAPIINPSTNNIVAILVVPGYLETFNTWAIFTRYYTTGTTSLHPYNPNEYALTEREKQVIFLFLLNLDSNSIAEILSSVGCKNISKSAIDQIFHGQLYPKFSVYSRKALHDKLIDLGYYRVIPRNILNHGFTIEISDYVYFD